jgi:hypothetical protein
MLNEGNQIHNFISNSGSGTVINYGSGSGSNFSTSYGSGSGSTRQKVTVPVPQHCINVYKYGLRLHRHLKTFTNSCSATVESGKYKDSLSCSIEISLLCKGHLSSYQENIICTLTCCTHV